MELKISLKTDRAFRQPLQHIDADASCLYAQWAHAREDGKFSGLNLSVQASPLHGQIGPDAVDSELFYQTVALVGAAPKLLRALINVVEQADPHGNNPLWLAEARAAIVDATSHPLHDAMEAEQREYDEARDACRDYDDDGDDRAYLYGDEDTGEDCNVELLQCAADEDREAATEDRLLGGAA